MLKENEGGLLMIEVKKSNPLRGNVSIPGSKNSSLPILIASCLCKGDITLKNIPDISDIDVVKEIIEDIGGMTRVDKDSIIVNTTGISGSSISIDKASKFRASYYFVGALLQRFKKVTIGYSGGDDFGSRPIDQHVKGLEMLGAKLTFYKDYYTVEAKELIGSEITFDVITSGATMNVLLAAVKAKGKTVLRNAAKDPEVVDLAIFLNKTGARVSGAGTDTITIYGVDSLEGCEHSIIPDRLLAGALLVSAGITKGEVRVDGVIPKHLETVLSKLTEIGLGIDIGQDWVKAFYKDTIKGVKIQAEMYPGFPTDLQQVLTTLLTQASNDSIIIDGVFPQRFKNCEELNKMEANITIGNGRILIKGKSNILGKHVHATDVRAGISLILAGLCAKGTTYISGVEHIERGFPNYIDIFNSLGCNIKKVDEKLIQKVV